MDNILKGNYKAPEVKKTEGENNGSKKTLEQEFEAAALKELGGSITFVKKGNTLVWRGKSEAPDQSKQEDKKNE